MFLINWRFIFPKCFGNIPMLTSTNNCIRFPVTSTAHNHKSQGNRLGYAGWRGDPRDPLRLVET